MLFIFAAHLFAQNKHARDFSPSLLKSHAAIGEQSPIDVAHYDVDLFVDMDGKKIGGRSQIELELLDSLTTSFFIHLTTPEILQATINNKNASFIRAGDKVYFTLAHPSSPILLDIEYSGTPGNDGFGGFFFVNGYAHTVGEGLNSADPSMLRHWIPSHDVPYDKATIDLRVTVPNDLDAFSNGVLLSTTAQNVTKTFHWQETNPIATYLIAIAVGNYVMLEKDYQSIAGHSIPLEFYVFPESVSEAEIDWTHLPTMMDFFERHFAPYPFERYSMAQAYNRGAMEHQQMTTYSYQLITGDNRYDYIMAHELAHHWWGDLVTLGDWRDIWLNEGFATYSEALYFESLYGQDYLAEYMDALQSVYLGEVSRRGHFPIYDPDYMWGGTIYQKGAWVLHMLRWTIGDDAFWNTLRTWAQRYAYGNALIPDFIQVAEEESGQDLTWFFDQWIYQAGYPDFDISWDYDKDGANTYTASLEIKQQQWATFQFKAPIEIAFETSTGLVMDTLVSSSAIQNFKIDLKSEPLAIHIDPNNWLLKQYDIISNPSPPGITPNEFYLAQNYPNPFLINGQTNIIYQVPDIGGPHPISIKIYNILGRHVATLVDYSLQGGLYKTSWDGKDMNGRTVSSGVYFYRLESQHQTIEKKLVIIEK